MFCGISVFVLFLMRSKISIAADDGIPMHAYFLQYAIVETFMNGIQEMKHASASLFRL